MPVSSLALLAISGNFFQLLLLIDCPILVTEETFASSTSALIGSNFIVGENVFVSSLDKLYALVDVKVKVVQRN